MKLNPADAEAQYLMGTAYEAKRDLDGAAGRSPKC